MTLHVGLSCVRQHVTLTHMRSYTHEKRQTTHSQQADTWHTGLLAATVARQAPLLPAGGGCVNICRLSQTGVMCWLNSSPASTCMSRFTSRAMSTIYSIRHHHHHHHHHIHACTSAASEIHQHTMWLTQTGVMCWLNSSPASTCMSRFTSRAMSTIYSIRRHHHHHHTVHHRPARYISTECD